MWELDYDSRGNVLSVRDGAGRVLESTLYDGQGRVVAEADLFGVTSYEQLTASGQPQRSVDPDGTVTTMAYSPYGEITNMVSPAGSWTFDYDASGRERVADYGGGMVHTTEYDALGRPFAESNPVSGRVARRLDAAGRLEAWELPGGAEMGYERDAAGRLERQVDPLGRASTFGYDAAGRVNTTSDAATGAKVFERDAVGRVTKVTNALGEEVTMEYHVDGSVALVRDDLGRETTFSGGPTWGEVRDPLLRTVRTETGPEGEVTRVVHADGAVESVSYLEGTPQGERDSYPIAIALPGGYGRSFSYDALGRLASATDLGGQVWAYGWDVSGRTLTVQSPGGAGSFVREDVYDAEFDLVSRRFGDGGVYTLSYGLGPDPIEITKPSGVVVGLGYDSSGRVVSRSTSSGESETLSWNVVGDPLGHVDESGATTWSYDAAGRPTSLVHSDGSAVSWGYDVLGRVVGVTVTPAGGGSARTTEYRYDRVGRVEEVEQVGIGVTTFGYDAGDRLVSRELPNGVRTTWEYDLRDRVTLVEHRDSASQVLASFGYQRGAFGQIERLDREDGSRVEWSYDAALRITAERRFDGAGVLVSEVGWSWDAAGNRTAEVRDGVTATATHLPGERLAEVQVGGAVTESYGWDADGRVTSIGREGESWSLGYDSKDALRSISDGATAITYTHDAMGRRRAASDGAGTRRFAVAPVAPGGLDMVHAVTSGGETSSFVWVGSHPLVRIDGDGGVRYQLEDGLGSIVALTDESGALAATRDWDSFGNLVAASGESDPTHLGGAFGFHGEWREEASGLYHLRARDYDPKSGRFLSRDPFEGDEEQPESQHPYQFAYGNPMVYRDPSGLFGISVSEVNITLNMNSLITTLKTQAVVQLKREVAQRIGEAITEFVFARIMGILGVALPERWRIVDGLTYSQLGGLFEAAAGESLCSLFGPQSMSVYFEVGVSSATGEAADDGFGCGQRPAGVARQAGNRYPDAILRLREQVPTAEGSKTIATLEMKLGVGSFYRAWFHPGRQRRQWSAIWRHATSYGYFPNVVILVALRDGRAYQHRAINGTIVQRRVRGVVISVL